MPFDPFFSSVNKKHYVPHESYQAVMALANEIMKRKYLDQWIWCREIKEKMKRHEATVTEIMAKKRVMFILLRKLHAGRRVIQANWQQCSAQMIAFTETRISGMNTISGARASRQKRAFKA